MSEPKPFASLSPTLLARKGGARPAMRPQIQPLRDFHKSAARAMEDDLGWNDMGEPLADHERQQHSALETAPASTVIPIKADDPSLAAPAAEPAAKPEVVRQQDAIVRSLSEAKQHAAPERSATADSAPRKSALNRGGRAAFTLRLDSERHLKLRLASTLSNRSAQQLVTEALDKLLEDMPDVASLASRVRQAR